MPGFIVSINDDHLVTISTENLNVFSIRLHGDTKSQGFALLEASGGFYGDEKIKRHLIWLNEHEIFPDDEITIRFLDEVIPSHSGKTIKELYPEEDKTVEPEGTIDEVFNDEEFIHDLVKKTKLRENFSFALELPSGELIRSSTDPSEYSFSYSILWNNLHPERARVSLSSNTLDSIFNKENGSYHLRVLLQLNQEVKLHVE